MDFIDFVECTYVNDLEFDSVYNTREREEDDSPVKDETCEYNYPNEDGI